MKNLQLSPRDLVCRVDEAQQKKTNNFYLFSSLFVIINQFNRFFSLSLAFVIFECDSDDENDDEIVLFLIQGMEV